MVLSYSDVESITRTLVPNELVMLMAHAFVSFSNPVASVQQPPRTSVRTTESSMTTLFMPSHLPQVGTGIKVVSVTERGLPATALLLNPKTGGVEAVVNARGLTAIRNAAG